MESTRSIVAALQALVASIDNAKTNDLHAETSEAKAAAKASLTAWDSAQADAHAANQANRHESNDPFHYSLTDPDNYSKTQLRAALQCAVNLCADYYRGELRGGSMEWDDLDETFDLLASSLPQLAKSSRTWIDRSMYPIARWEKEGMPGGSYEGWVKAMIEDAEDEDVEESA